TLRLDAAQLGKLRRNLMSHGPRNQQVSRVPSALLDALWRQVRSERGRERGRELFNDDLLNDQRFVDFTMAWWPPLDAAEVLGWLREPGFLAQVADGILTSDEQKLLLAAWDRDTSLTIEDIPLLD